MTGQIIPFPNMKNLNPAMIMQFMKMQSEMAALEAEQQEMARKSQMKHPQANNWRNITKKPDQSDSLMSLILGAALFGGLFDSSMMGGIAQLGMMNMAENANEPNPAMDSFSKLNNGMKADTFNPMALLGSSKDNSGSQLMNILLLVMIMKMMNKTDEGEDSAGGSTGMTAKCPLGRNLRLVQLRREMEEMCGSNGKKKLLLNQKNDMLSCKKYAAKLAM